MCPSEPIRQGEMMKSDYIKLSYKGKRAVDRVSWVLVLAGLCVALALVLTRGI